MYVLELGGPAIHGSQRRVVFCCELPATVEGPHGPHLGNGMGIVMD